jgi:hypothetical protein
VRLSTIRKELDGVLAELATVEAERDRLLANGIVEPTPAEWRTADRTGRPGAPLWRLLDWREHVEGRTQAGIEAALQAAGLLDAWVLPDGSVSAGVTQPQVALVLRDIGGTRMSWSSQPVAVPAARTSSIRPRKNSCRAWLAGSRRPSARLAAPRRLRSCGRARR